MNAYKRLSPFLPLTLPLLLSGADVAGAWAAIETASFASRPSVEGLSLLRFSRSLPSPACAVVRWCLWSVLGGSVLPCTCGVVVS